MTPEILQGISLGEDDREEGSSCSNSSAKNIDTEQENTVKLNQTEDNKISESGEPGCTDNDTVVLKTVPASAIEEKETKKRDL